MAGARNIYHKRRGRRFRLALSFYAVSVCRSSHGGRAVCPGCRSSHGGRAACPCVVPLMEGVPVRLGAA